MHTDASAEVDLQTRLPITLFFTLFSHGCLDTASQFVRKEFLGFVYRQGKQSSADYTDESMKTNGLDVGPLKECPIL